MAFVHVGGEDFQSFTTSFLHALPYIDLVVRRKCARHPDLPRVILDTQEIVWSNAKRKWDQGMRGVRLDLKPLINQALQDKGIEKGNKPRRRHRTQSSDQLLRNLRAKLEVLDLRLDLQEAIASLAHHQQRIIRLLLEGAQWNEIERLETTNVWAIHAARQELKNLLRDYR